MATNQDSKDLNKALNLAIFGVIGCIIPIVGLFVSIVALIIASGIRHTTITAGKKRTVTTVAVIGILLSLASGFAYYMVYSTRIHNEQQQKIEACSQEVTAMKNRTLALNIKYDEDGSRFKQTLGADYDYKKCSDGIDSAINKAKVLYSDALVAGKNRCIRYYEKQYNDGFLKESQSLGRNDGKLPQANADRWENRLTQWKNDCNSEFPQ